MDTSDNALLKSQLIAMTVIDEFLRRPLQALRPGITFNRLEAEAKLTNQALRDLSRGTANQHYTSYVRCCGGAYAG